MQSGLKHCVVMGWLLSKGKAVTQTVTKDLQGSGVEMMKIPKYVVYCLCICNRKSVHNFWALKFVFLFLFFFIFFFIFFF